ncbi:MAG: hypothetical protein IJ851_00860 [Eubacterium sp.]|nr:hypothetical protein [Eubacterium sp.]
MNLDANVQKLLMLVLKRWRLILIVALIGTMAAYFYTANFVDLTYTSTVEFLAYTQDAKQDLSDSTNASQTVSNTSKMNYAIKMLSTYIELFQTNEFNQTVAEQLNEENGQNYSGGVIKGAVTIETVPDTAMFKITVTTKDADTSYQIAKQLETSIPEKMNNTNNGLVGASVEDSARKATTSEKLGYPKKCAIGFLAGAVLAIAFVILRDLLDVRIKSSDELSERYGVPILGTIPEFEIKANNNSRLSSRQTGKSSKSDGNAKSSKAESKAEAKEDK